MRILYITSYYPPEIVAGATRVSELAGYWVRDGHEVTVLTNYPNHPTGRVPAEYARGHWWRIHREQRDGVRVVRTPLIPAPNRGTFRRALKFGSSAVSACAVAPWLERADVVISTSPQLLTIVPGLLVQATRRVPLVFEIRDLWPEQMIGVGYSAGSPLVTALRRLVRFAYRRATHIVAVSPAYAPILERDYGIRREKVSLIPNGVNTAVFRPEIAPVRERFGLSSEQFVVGFAGTLGLSQRFGPVLEAAERLQKLDPSVRFLLIGDGARRQAIEQSIRERGLSNVGMFGLQPREAMPGVLASMDAALVLLESDPYFRVALPSKMFELMAMGRPLLMMAQGVAEDLARQAQCGLAAQDGAELTAAILRLRAEPETARRLGQAGRVYVKKFERERLAAEYIELLQRLTGRVATRAAAAAAG